jgi:GTPase SAR1 family protein
MYLRDANVAILCYDISDQSSLQELELWIDEFRKTCADELIIALCGTKLDGVRQVSLAQGQELSRKWQCALFSEVSCRTRENMDFFMAKIARTAWERRNLMPVNNRESIQLRRENMTKQKVESNSSCC